MEIVGDDDDGYTSMVGCPGRRDGAVTVVNVIGGVIMRRGRKSELPKQE